MALLDEKARGVYAIAPTPFTDDGALDLASTDRMVDFYLAAGVDGLTILGVMGEAPKLAPEESLAFVERVLRRLGGRLPVVVGASSPALRQITDLSRRVMAMGAAGVMVSPMTGLRNEEQVWTYVAAVAEALGPEIPVVFQDYPQLTQVFMSAATVNRAFATFPSFKVWKHEEAPGLRKLSAVRAAEAGGAHRRISILVGNGGIHLPQELARGADGAMTGFAFPEMLVGVCRHWAAGEEEKAEDLYDCYLPLVRHEQQPGIGLALRKETLRRRGVLASARLRPPGPVLDAADQRELGHLLARLERALTRAGLPAPLAASAF
jgi:4-hydroxy-tetrahydrodipicolinate synthase